MRRLAIALLLVSACGGPPVLSRVPRPNTAVVAAAAIGVATAATIADPKSAGRKPETRTPADDRPLAPQQMPGDVLDRLDAAEARDAGPP
jgi:hypothetical protein